MMYMLDTNAVTALMKANPVMARSIRRAVDRGDSIRIGGMSYYEVKRGLLAASAGRQMARFEAFCTAFGILLFDDVKVLDEASRIYADLKAAGRLIGDADILIAALAKTKQAMLITDDSDFRHVAGLKTENWMRE